MSPAAALLALLLAPRIAVPASEPPARARYVASREGVARGLALPSHQAHGFRQRARLLPDGSTELTVVTESRPGSAAPPPPRAEAERAFRRGAAVAETVRRLAEEIAHGAEDDWEISQRVLTWVSLNVRHADEPGHAEDAESSLAARVASCVGRSRLAADLLVAAGVPARTVHGLLAQPGDGREFLLHRFVETWIDGVGWVPSDPGESIHVVDARHVFIATDDAPYDPEAQRGLRLRAAEPVAGALLATPAGTARPLIVGERPRSLPRSAP